MTDARITLKLKCPNPLFEEWLTEWRDAERVKNTRKQHCYNKALESLKRYPLPLPSGKDCIILQGFGAKLCQMLDDKLTKLNKNDVNQVINANLDNNQSVVNDVTPKRRAKRKSDVLKRNKEYVPTTRSGGYAILLALYKDSLEENSMGFLKKGDLIEKAQEYCDTSFIKADPGSFYTAWSSMSLLITKKLVEKEGNPPKFSLSDSGVELGHRLHLSSLNEVSIYDNNENDKESGNKEITRNINNRTTSTVTKLNNNYDNVDVASTSENTTKKTLGRNPSATSITSRVTTKKTLGKNPSATSFISQVTTEEALSINPSTTSITSQVTTKKALARYPSSSSVTSASSNLDNENLIFAPNSFNIILLVDTQETAGAGKKAIEDETKLELNSLKVPYEIRHLKVGDYTWICREQNTQKELVLPYVIERKRMDDFGASIKDGRFHEQKFRLKQCGIQNLIYLVESYGGNKHTGLPLTSLHQAATNTLIQDEFSLKFTPDFKASMKYLAVFTTILSKIYKDKTLVSCQKADLIKSTTDDDIIALMTFNEFNKSASKQKQFKVKELFVKQLLQLKGVSVERALAVVDKYQTPRQLKEKYNSCSEKEGETLLSGIQFGNLQKKIGLPLSKTIYQLYTIKK